MNKGWTFIPTPAISLGSRLKSPSSTATELIRMICYITMFKEETTGISEHPVELLDVPSGKIEKTGVTNPECDRTPGRPFTLTIECKDLISTCDVQCTGFSRVGKLVHAVQMPPGVGDWRPAPLQ